MLAHASRCSRSLLLGLGLGCLSACTAVDPEALFSSQVSAPSGTPQETDPETRALGETFEAMLKAGAQSRPMLHSDDLKRRLPDRLSGLVGAPPETSMRAWGTLGVSRAQRNYQASTQRLTIRLTDSPIQSSGWKGQRGLLAPVNQQNQTATEQSLSFGQHRGRLRITAGPEPRLALWLILERVLCEIDAEGFPTPEVLLTTLKPLTPEFDALADQVRPRRRAPAGKPATPATDLGTPAAVQHATDAVDASP